MVAKSMVPARKPNALADIALTEGAAGVGPVTMHGYSKSRCRRREAETCLQRASGFTRGNPARQPNAPPKPRPSRNNRKPAKLMEKQRILWIGGARNRVSICAACLY